MGNFKLVALDMDGTLLNDRCEISDENALWIRKAVDAGVTVCFSTGRGFRSALPYAELLKLDTPMITVNGSEIWLRPFVLHHRTYLDAASVERLHCLAMKHETWYWAYTIDQIYNKERWVPSDHAVGDFRWLKFGFDTPFDTVRSLIHAEIQSWGGLEISNSSPTNWEINPQGVSKASALQELCRLLGLDMSQVVAVGDSLNDIAAIREAGLGVAMGNAQEEVMAAADVITMSNNDDGVARVIEQYVLKRDVIRPIWKLQDGY